MVKSYHFSCPKCNNNHSFYRYGKDPDGIRNISAETAIINLHPNARGRRGQIVGGATRPARFVEKPASCTTIMSTTATTVAATKSAITHSLFGSLQP